MKNSIIHDGCPQENNKLLGIIKENPRNCIAVVAGHLHFAVNGNVTTGVPQFVASQAITGHINKYIIGIQQTTADPKVGGCFS